MQEEQKAATSEPILGFFDRISLDQLKIMDEGRARPINSSGNTWKSIRKMGFQPIAGTKITVAEAKTDWEALAHEVKKLTYNQPTNLLSIFLSFYFSIYLTI